MTPQDFKKSSISFQNVLKKKIVLSQIKDASEDYVVDRFAILPNHYYFYARRYFSSSLFFLYSGQASSGCLIADNMANVSISILLCTTVTSLVKRPF